MAIDIKGEDILKKVDFEKFRNEFIESIMKKISSGGTSGCHVDTIISESLKDEAFKGFVSKLAEVISKELKTDRRQTDKAMSTLVEEDIREDINNNLGGQTQSRAVRKSPGKEQTLYKQGSVRKLWKNKKFKQLLGRPISFLGDIVTIFAEHRILKCIICTGIVCLSIAAFLFRSVYKAIIVGLTLTAFKDGSVFFAAANIMGGIGGILIFFTSITILLQYTIMKKNRDEQLREIAKQFLEKRGQSQS